MAPGQGGAGAAGAGRRGRRGREGEESAEVGAGPGARAPPLCARRPRGGAGGRGAAAGARGLPEPRAGWAGQEPSFLL